MTFAADAHAKPRPARRGRQSLPSARSSVKKCLNSWPRVPTSDARTRGHLFWRTVPRAASKGSQVGHVRGTAKIKQHRSPPAPNSNPQRRPAFLLFAIKKKSHFAAASTVGPLPGTDSIFGVGPPRDLWWVHRPIVGSGPAPHRNANRLSNRGHTRTGNGKVGCG